MDLRAFFDPSTPLGMAWATILFVGVLFWAFRGRRRRRRPRPGPGADPG